MKNIFCFIFLCAVVLHSGRISAQLCDPSTPLYTVDLSGNPGGVWTSPSHSRHGQCCSAVSPDVCVEFILTLDSAAIGINFNITSGAIPPGSLYYQINCGPPIPVGQPICLNGAGPHHLTFCKPGNNPNEYSITSFGDPAVEANVNASVSPACSALLIAQATNVETLTWTSLPSNNTYNSFLNCTTNCDTVTVTPYGSFPSYIDYMVCGTGIGGCSNGGGACDTVRVHLYHDVAVSVSPAAITLCNGVTTTTLTASASGASGAYQFLWTNGDTTSSIQAGAGTYHITVTDTATCAPATDSATIIVLPPIIANAGSDLTICANQPSANLNGSLQTATAATWNGGSGYFNPNNGALNAVYTPSASEIANGFAQLVLGTTANQGCPPAYDTVRINIVQPPLASISGNLISCVNSSASYTTALLPGCSYAWNVSGGTIQGSSISNSISVDWGTAASGTVSVIITNSNGCQGSDSKTVSLVVAPNPVVTGVSTICQYSLSTYAVASAAGSTYAWTVTNGTITGSANNNSVLVNWNSYGSSGLTVTETNSFGCTSTNSMLVTINQQPVPLISGNTVVCAGNSPVRFQSPLNINCTYDWSVSGGTIVSANGSNVIDVLWNPGLGNSVTLTVSNTAGCDSTMILPVSAGLLAPISVQANSASGCPPLNVSISGNAPVAGQTYSWSFGDQWCSAAANPTHVYSNPGTYNLNVITRNAGCIDSVGGIIHVLEVPAADFRHNFEHTPYVIGESTLELVNFTEKGTSFLWTFGTGDTSNAFQPSMKFEKPGIYPIQLISFSDGECPDTMVKEIHVIFSEHLYIPDAFTPNGDDVNDYFSLVTTHIERAEITILNRWGESIFQSDDLNFKWDGRLNGNPVELGVYVYKINATGEGGKMYSMIGTVTVLR